MTEANRAAAPMACLWFPGNNWVSDGSESPSRHLRALHLPERLKVSRAVPRAVPQMDRYLTPKAGSTASATAFCARGWDWFA